MELILNVSVDDSLDARDSGITKSQVQDEGLQKFKMLVRFSQNYHPLRWATSGNSGVAPQHWKKTSLCNRVGHTHSATRAEWTGM